MPILELPTSAAEPEHRALYQPVPVAHVGVILQGSVDTFEPVRLPGQRDEPVEVYKVRLIVGPYWRDVQSVVPKVTIDGFYSSNPDIDDYMRWQVRNLRWETVGPLGPHDELRIRLKFEVAVQGQSAYVTRLGYLAFASGRALGQDGLNAPGPVNDQG